VPEGARLILADERPVRLSPVSALELAYMHEIGRARDPVPVMLAALRTSIGLEVSDLSLSQLTEAAIGLSWTRDPFDRMIAAHAIVADAPLLTADRTMLKHLPQATWS
jgi:PIN domain nuclease of toxin-antitoxin system